MAVVENYVNPVMPGPSVCDERVALIEYLMRLEPTTLLHPRLAICWQIRNPYLRDVMFENSEIP